VFVVKINGMKHSKILGAWMACGLLLVAPAFAQSPAAKIVGGATAENFVANSGFETQNNVHDDKGTRTPGTWTIYGSRAQIVDGGREGGKALKVVRPATARPDEMDGAAYTVQWEEGWKWPLEISAWSKAENATGIGGAASAGDYAIYCDLSYADGSNLFAQIAPFNQGTHDWEKTTLQIVPEKPFKTLTVYLLFRGAWQGTVWFDDLKVQPLDENEMRALSNRGRPLPGKIIEFGWDMSTLTAEFVRDNWREMEKQPFDGVIMRVGDSYLFDADKRNDADYAAAREAMKDVRWTKFTDNFVVAHANPGTVDFFDAEWDNILASTGALARFARDAKLKGICFDPEAYVPPHAVFDYTQQKYRDKYTFAEYSAKARERGRQWMQSLQTNFPGLTILTLFGPSANWNLVSRPDLQAALKTAPWGLYAPFMDGMFDVIEPNVRFVDGCEWGYYMTSRADFLEGFRKIKSDCQVFFSPENRAKYRAQVYVGFGLYPDREWRNEKYGWNADNPSKNFYPPAKFQENLNNALHAADEYVWVYTEGERNWWKEPSDIPPAYVEALKNGRWMP
jgi:hypothetical protein